MLLGIISDTHNQRDMTLRALEIFSRRRVDMILHAGDIQSPDMLRLFCDFPSRFVLGNEDRDVEEINEESRRLGFGPVADHLILSLNGKRLIMFHGIDVPFFRNTVASGEYDFIIKGHTHFFENYVSNRSRIINPGALCAAYEYTVAVLDTEADMVEMVEIRP